MKIRKSILSFFALPCLIFLLGWSPDPKNPPKSGIEYKMGEKLVYKVHYSIFNAGEATITLDKKIHTVDNKECYRANVFGRSIGAFDLILRIRDTWRSYYSTETHLPEKFFRYIEEGNYFLNETTTFDHDQRSVHVVARDRDGNVKKKNDFGIVNQSFDIVSGIYYLRTLDYSKMTPGYKFDVSAFFEDSTYTLTVKYLGKDRIRTKFGKVYAHVFTPIMPGNQMFEEGENTIKVYMSDTPDKIPLKIRAEMFVGAVECDLKSYSGTKVAL